MSSVRRLCVGVLGPVGFVIGLVILQFVHAQVVRPRVIAQPVPVQVLLDGSETPAPTFSSAVRFPRDSKAQQAIRSAADLIDDKNWPKACEALQFLLSRPEDGFIQVTRSAGTAAGNTITTSIRNEVNRLIGIMPKDGLEVYETLYGARAKIDLDEAKSRRDAYLLAEVALKFLHTKAGAEAMELLGTHCLERDEPIHAALWFERLVDRPGADDLPARVFFKAALAFTRAGSREMLAMADETWKKLETKSRRDGGIQIGDEFVKLERVRAEFNTLVREEPRSQRDWAIYRGAPDRNAQGIGGYPFMEAAWQFSTLPDPTLRTNPSDRAAAQRSLEKVKDLLNRAVSDLGREFKQPLMPAFFPVAVNGKLICRTYDGLHLLDARQNGKPQWWVFHDGGLRLLYSDNNKVTQVDQWASLYQTNGPKTILFENSVIGSLSTDGIRAYAVDDLILPPHSGDINQFQRGMAQPQFFGHLAELVNHNTLKAYDIESDGMLDWELGGKFDTSKLKDSFFLGAPLPVAGKLYVLNEQHGELRLVCLEPYKRTTVAPPPPRIVWIQPLATTKDPIQFDLNRRIHAAQLAYSDGVLICPTNAGAVLGVELLQHSLLWAYSYRETNQAAKDEKQPAVPFQPMIWRGGVWNGMNTMRPTTLNSEWRVSAPAIHDGKVVFTAPDGKSIHCVNLKNGSAVWTKKRQPDDLYFAGIIHGKVVVVGKNHVRALSLVDREDKDLWSIANTGLPSGQGTASDNVYYVPIQASAETKEPEVLAIDVDRGAILAHTKSRRHDGKMEVPGNLIFHEGQVISQGLTEIKSYPQIQVKLAEIDRLLSKNPRDARGLVERGELRLDKGELQGASDDLHEAVAVLGPAPSGEQADLLGKAETKLFECFMEMLQRDFSRGERYLDECKKLCNRGSSEEQLKRLGNFYCLLAKGREDQGRLLEAFDSYLAFAGIGTSNELVTVIDQPNTKCCRDVWARGRIAAMMAHAAPEQRRPLEQKIADQWRALQDSNNLDELRRFVALFGSAFQVGKQAKLRLAEKLIAENKEESLREAQLLLLPLRAAAGDPQLAGQAIDALARLMIQKGALDHAAFYYQELGRDFGGILIRDGKTGADLYRELATDKRFLPYLEGSRTMWNARFSRGEDLPGGGQLRQILTMEPVGDVLPFFHRNRLVLETVNQQSAQLCILDQDTGEVRYKGPNLPAAQVLFQNGPQNVRVPYYLQGHVVTFQMGHMVYCFDAVDQKKLWEFNVYAPGQKTAPQNVIRDPVDGKIKEVFIPENFKRSIGHLGPVQASYVCMQTPRGLIAVDPLKGTTLWTKEGVSLRTESFGDEQYLYIVDLDDRGAATSARRAVRAADGVMISVPDFTKAYQNKLQGVGRRLLVKDENAQRELVLRLTDVHSGKDVWQRSFPAGSIALKPDGPRFAGAIEPNGALTILDLHSGEEVLKTTLNRKDVLQRRGLDIAQALDKVTDAHLLFDRDLFYVALNKPAENVNGGAVWMNAHGLRCLPVNGMMYAFDRHRSARPDRSLRWAELVPNQMLVMEQFQQLPLLLFTSRYLKLIQNGPNRIHQYFQSTRTMHKRSGLLLYDKETVNNNTQFHAVEVNAKEGRIDFVNQGFRIRHKVQTVAAAR